MYVIKNSKSLSQSRSKIKFNTYDIHEKNEIQFSSNHQRNIFLKIKNPKIIKPEQIYDDNMNIQQNIKTAANLKRQIELNNNNQSSKKQLIHELEKIDHKINLIKQKNLQERRRSQEHTRSENMQKTERAKQLIRRLNHQKRQRKLRKQKLNQGLKQYIDQSIKTLTQQKQRDQKMQKRNKIIERIKLIKQKKLNKRYLRKFETPQRFKTQITTKNEENDETKQNIFLFTQIDTSLQQIPKIKKYPKTSFLKLIEQQQKIASLEKQIKQKQKILNNQRMRLYNKIHFKERTNSLLNRIPSKLITQQQEQQQQQEYPPRISY